MDNRWVEKILEAMIDGARELDSAPLDRDIKEIINRFVDNKYQPICRKKALESFSKILFKVLNNIELDSDVFYAYEKRKKVDPFEEGILYLGLKTAEEYQPAHVRRRLDRIKEKETDSFFTVAEIASKYGYQAQTITGWIRNNKLKADKIGKSYRIKASDWEEFKRN